MRLFLMVLIVLIAGCSPHEIKKLILGTSLYDFKVAEKKFTKIVALPTEDCFNRVHDILADKKVIIQKSDFKNKLIVAYGFRDFFKPKAADAAISTTEVGILFKEMPEGKTEITIISDNYSLGEFVANDIFSKLESN
ncbi:MAG: hypothetical protein PHQ96_08550 [Candidatus Omnitrophica bacterium]|nr:hypothetical protein [Candidatus Omnitrophota bacterium]